MVFPFKEKGFPRKSLCSCVVELSLYLLKFIYSYIEFFSQHVLDLRETLIIASKDLKNSIDLVYLS